MAEDLTAPAPPPVPPGPEVTPAPDATLVDRQAVPVRSYTGRFAIAYGILAFVAVVAVIVLIGASSVSSPNAGPAWSQFVPKETAEETIPTAIADYVGPRYTLPDGTQMVAITGTAPTFQGVPLAAIAVQPRSGAADQSVRVVDAAGTISYAMCGLGPQCAIASGKPSVERERLLRREALELALYTFRYMPAIENVLAFLPPRKGEDPDVTMFFERSAYADLLDRPLGRTLPQSVPGVTTIPAAEVLVIDRYTDKRRFGFEVQQLQDGSPVIILDQLVQ